MPQTVRKLLPMSFSILFVLFFAATIPASLRAQSGYSAQLSGVISDSSGGGVPDAKVTLVDEDTGIARTYATDNLGIYVFTGSAEYGNNEGTVVNIVLKEGKNKLHGSGWWFGQRSAMDANEFFRNKFDIPNPDHARDQYGFSLGGPIKKEKTFFFIDFEKTRQNDPVNIDAFVPTALERNGDFRNTQVICSDSANGCTVGEAVQQRIFNPRNIDTGGNRQDFAVPNVIDSGLIDPIGQAIISLYPQPTVDDAGPGEFNYHAAVLSKFSARQFDIKLDHHFSEKNRISGRYSNHHDEGSIPTIVGDGDFNDGFAFSTDVHNAVIEHNWSPTPTTIGSPRFRIAGF